MRTLRSIAAALIMAGATSMHARANAVVDQCRRDALNEYTQSAAYFDSQADFYKKNIDSWKHDSDSMMADYDKQPRHGRSGTFGDVHAFDHLARSPAQIANDDLAYVQAAEHAVAQAVGLYDKQRAATPDDPNVYCDYYFAKVHDAVLLHAELYATERVGALNVMEAYFRLRLTVASGVSADAYSAESKKMSDDLLDIYETQHDESEKVRRLVNAATQD